MDNLVKQIYDLAMASASSLTKAVSPLLSDESNRKIVRFIKGRRDVLGTVRNTLCLNPHRKTIWVHCASLGEFGIARPLVKELSERFNIVLTFFSPSGYDVLKNDTRYRNVFYLPWDSKANAREFIDLISPDAAMFMVSEYWHNYLRELKRRNIPVFLVSALIKDSGVFFKWYGADYRKDLRDFTHIFALDNQSADNLRRLGLDNFSVSGDPLFDNACVIAKRPYSNAKIETFKGHKKIFVAGSIGTDQDLDMVSTLANEFPGTKFIVAPHVVTPSTLSTVEKRFRGRIVRCSEHADDETLHQSQILIVDYIGELASIYRYGTWAYIGGGFTPYLHSLVEAVVYGLPVSFGPETNRKITPEQLIEIGVGCKVRDYNELKAWFENLKNNNDKLENIKKEAMQYVSRNVGATDGIVQAIASSIKK